MITRCNGGRAGRGALTRLAVVVATLAVSSGAAAVSVPAARATVQEVFVLEAPTDGAVVSGPEYEFRVRVYDPGQDPEPALRLDGVDLNLTPEWTLDEDSNVATFKWDSRSVPNGDYEVQVYDLLGLYPDSEPVVLRVDNTAPDIFLTSPTAGFVSGSVSLAAAASAPRDIREVYFLVDGELIGRDVTAPYQLLLDSATLRNGRHELLAVAVDVSGVEAASPTSTVVVHNAVDLRRYCPEGSFEDGFFDVPSSNIHEAAIDCAVGFQLAQGRSYEFYDPSGLVTRAQMATFIARLVERHTVLPDSPSGVDYHRDDDGSVHEENINRLAQVGILTGFADGSYGPDRHVTRGQMSTFIARALEYVRGAALGSTADYFGDDNGHPHEGSINKMAETGVTVGGAGRTYAADRAVPRDQMASFLVRADAVAAAVRS